MLALSAHAFSLRHDNSIPLIGFQLHLAFTGASAVRLAGAAGQSSVLRDDERAVIVLAEARAPPKLLCSVSDTSPPPLPQLTTCHRPIAPQDELDTPPHHRRALGPARRRALHRRPRRRCRHHLRARKGYAAGPLLYVFSVPRHTIRTQVDSLQQMTTARSSPPSAARSWSSTTRTTTTRT
jgi:hypothetical protein